MKKRTPLIDQIKQAFRRGQTFNASLLRDSIRGFAYSTYSTFLSKHRLDNPGDYTAYFKRISRGSYVLL